MAEIDETEVSMLSESDHKEVDVHVELDGSDDVEITMDETVEREELEVTTGKLDETDGTLIFTEREDHIRVSSDSGGLSISYSHNVKRLVAQFEKYPIQYTIQIIDRLRWLAGELTTALCTPIDPNVDFSKHNICSIKPINKEPDKNPNAIFTVTLYRLKSCQHPEKGLKVQFKPGNPTGRPELIIKGTSLIPSPKPKK